MFARRSLFTSLASSIVVGMNASTSHENKSADIRYTRAVSRLGMKCGGCELVEIAGIGGMNTSYVAHDVHGNVFVVKIPHDSRDPRAIVALHREYEASRRIKHRNVVEIHEMGQTESGDLYLLMDYVDGQTFDERRLQCGGRLPISDVLDCAIQVAAMLETVHAANVVHVDINLGNILLANGSDVVSAYMIDFGAAKISATTNAPAFDDPRAKQSNQFTGTFGCAAPEQFGNYAKIDERTDLYALAAMMHMGLTGQYPNAIVPGKMNLLEWVGRRCIDQTAPIATLAPIPQPVAEVIDKALRLDPSDRFADASSFREALERARQRAGV